VTAWQRASGERGQASVETLAVVPFLVAAAVGLCAAGLWFRQTVESEAAVASAAVALLETPDPTDASVLSRRVGSSRQLRIKRVGRVFEVTAKQEGLKFAGVTTDRSASLRWVEAAQ
jgi:Flp pilus assembly protein TadG